MEEVGKCLICEKLTGLIEFEVNGSKYKICKDCKKKIIRGLKLCDDILDSIVREDLLVLRKQFLKTLGHSVEWIGNRIKYERFISSMGNGGVIKNKSRCMVCAKIKRVRMEVPMFIKMFNRSKKSNFGIPLCNECKKVVTHVTMNL